MNNVASNQNTVLEKERGYQEQYQAKVSAYMAKQPAIVRGLHYVLQGLFLICLVIACGMFVAALYYTFVWAFIGALTILDDAWINFGLSMSLIPSPNKLMQSTSREIAMPGKTANQVDALIRS